MCAGLQSFQTVQAYSGTKGREYCPAGGVFFPFGLLGTLDLFKKPIQRINFKGSTVLSDGSEAKNKNSTPEYSFFRIR